jgi:adenosine deaminase
MNSATDIGWFERLPKVELHLHLEGAIPPEALWELFQKYGGDPAIPTWSYLKRKFVYRDFRHFIQTWNWITSLLRQYEDFTFAAHAIARDLERQNIRYAEVFYSPPDFLPAGLEPQRLTEAIRDGLRRVPGVEVALVFDLVRNFGPEQGARMLACANQVRDLGVIGVGIGGAENGFPPEPFAPVFRRARELGFRTSAHAGEAAGPASIWGAIRTLEVDRIGHGTRAVEDPVLVDYLAARKIPLELCVLSNVRMCVVPDVRRHPAHAYFQRGIPLSINTDDPTLFGNSLAEEYAVLCSELGFTQKDVLLLIEQGIEASWLPETRKGELLAQYRTEFAPLGTANYVE